MATPLARRLLAAAPRAPFELFFAAVTLYSARPAFASLHLPLQDLPQHMAAIAVLKRYAFDASLRELFELTLSRTQYLLVYALGVALSAPFGVEYAARLLVALTVVALPYALRYALARTGGEQRLAVLAWPFAFNPQMMLGFLNFLLGVPLALWAVGLFADPQRRAEKRRQLGLAALALGAFYAHLVPYGLLGLGVLVQLDARELTAALRGDEPAGDEAAREPLAARARRALAAAPALARRWFLELRFLLPSFAAVALWVLRSPARDASVRAGGVGRELVLTWPDRLALPAQFRETVLDAQGDGDMRALLAWGLALLVVAAASRTSARASAASERPSSGARVAYLPAACALLYVLAPESYGWIWPIHTRFAVAAVLLLPLLFGPLRSAVVAWSVALACAWGTVGLSNELTVNFQRWDREELGDLDEALARARAGRRLVALVPVARSAYVAGNVPLLHAAAYYQVRGGNVATFSFADFPQSPFRFREGPGRPERLPPRWEWQSSLRVADPTMSYYDYVLVRAGYHEEHALPPERYRRIFEGDAWRLYERRAP